MKTWSWIAAALLPGVLACSSGGSGGFPGSGSGDNGGASGSGSSESGSNGGSNSGSVQSSGSGSSGGDISDAGVVIPTDGPSISLYDAQIPDADLDAPIVLTMSPFVVHAHQEVYMCQEFGNPFGKDVDIIKMDGYMSAGSHHFFLFNMDATTGRTQPAAIAACPGGGKEFHPFPFLSQTPGHYIVTYPQSNMGYPMVAKNGLMMNVHYLNTSDADISPTASITIYPAKAGVVTQHVGSIFLNNTFFSVPATAVKQWFPSTSTPITSEPYTIISNWSHMHQWATDFQAITNNSVFYEETDWSEPPLITAAPPGVTPVPKNTSALLPLQMKAGQSITWQCNYTNTTGQTLTFGDSAVNNVMCIYIGQYYPADTTSLSYPDIVSVLNGT